ncbi:MULTISPECIES: alpha-ketoacid dehydrogenase subunit alpha/beta [Sphaerochaeta]|jgi:2-oxoisovalerate dehydrogenase E1 component|uniref:Thiamine pyrophosphate-dependent enzyme n=1 Tax=Sphaerochaeta associata TaxID=1129264 RepID=A0ABY4D7R4_9SPIR|nr:MULTISPECIES: alpha-ketoacid dehydrogenase subunit alpha/beta [Sphaerochaeta]MDT3359009.1 dehydrogenase [Spirochaetota bacterium]MDD3423165.1 thiamine pyrophosphate-dependent enzyme [Sphaerochaeta sp.]MDD3456621.1 thiamine pyrophosphate-dependent enzyme [Sphaerochaeta sp.]MDD4038192.1 thiamine pyrophosphate-dependent enzyme [Sphaerochaeta sp.]MDD4449263.1 thiamine pyrophosphate-dependent enzyme [Sphaerochaeta sp.]
MSKTLPFDPATLREKQIIKTPSIPVNQYQSDFKKELKLYGKDRLVRAYYDMLLIRKFETMLDTIKKEGVYQGISYNHKGPAHLSAGQESAAVGQAMVLEPEDQIFGSHRSHGEILAKSMSAIHKMEDKDLLAIMEGFMNGETYKVIASHFPGKDVRDTAENFVLYGALAEIYAKKTGFNAGLGGSMHTFFKPFGSMPNNAIVGGSCTIAVGAALYKKINRKKGIVIANIGDGSLARGPVYEGLVLSSMDQYKTLWEENPGYPPFMLNCFDNLYAMGGQPIGETMGYKVAARVGAAINEYSMHTERVDGFNPLAVADATARKKELLLKGEGPAFLDTLTYRYSGHSPSDAMTYRSKEELEAFRNQDPIVAYGNYLIENGVLVQADLDAMDVLLEEKMRMTLQITVDPKLSPMVDEAFVESVMFSNGSVEKFDDAKPAMLQSLEENPRVQQIAKRNRYAYDENGKEYPAARQYQYRDAVFEAMAHRFSIDPTMIAYGEDHRDWGGAFACYRGLTELLPPSRFFNSPIAESAIVGSGVGYAMAGGRAVVELMYCDFLGCAGDEVFNQMPKWQAMSAGVLKMPLVLRVSVGNKYGAQHSQEWTSMVASVPGLKAMYPATPYDVKGMLNYALRGTDPVVFFESQKLYGIGEMFEKGGVPEGYYEIPEGEPAIRREGKDVTLVALGPALYTAIAAADKLAEHGLSAEVIDLRWINPLKYEMLIESVRKTGRCVMVTDSAERGSYLHTVASNLSRLAFEHLDAPIVIAGSKNWITPPAEMEEYYFAQPSSILDAIHEQILPIAGYTPKHNFTDGEFFRTSRKGV